MRPFYLFYPEAGRVRYLRSLWTLDVAIPVLVSLWLATGIALAQRARAAPPRAWFTLLPVVAGAADLPENTGISILLVRDPERLDSLAALAALTGDVTSAKHLLYVASLLILAFMGIAALVRRARARRT